MTNHVRTLLRNLTSSADYAAPFAEYSPALSQAIRLPTGLATLWRTLFGLTPDVAGIEYRLRQYMELVHASGLAAYATAVDPRITYLPFRDDMANPAFARRVTAVGHSRPLYVVGGDPIPSGNALRFAWTIRKTSTTGVLVRRDSPSPGDTAHTLSFAANLSSEFPLLGSDYLARIPGGVPTGTTWMVEFTGRPRESLGEIAAAIAVIGEPILLDLFGVSPQGDDLVFRTTWTQSTDLADRLAAVLLALSARMDTLRAGRAANG